MTQGTTRRVSATQLDVLKKMADGWFLRHRREVCESAWLVNQTTVVVSAVVRVNLGTLNGLWHRGLIQHVASESRCVDRYELSPAGRSALSEGATT